MKPEFRMEKIIKSNSEWEYFKLDDTIGPPSDLRSNFAEWEFPKIFPGIPTKYNWIIYGYDKKNPEKLKIGYGSDISAFTVIFAHSGVEIEPYVQIGPHSSIISKSTIDNKEGPVHLKYNSRIGAYSTIMPGVTIGENSIIGAYSFVNKDIPPNSIAMGIPCKIIKKF